MNNYRRLLSLAMIMGLATQMITSCGEKDDPLPAPPDPVLTSFSPAEAAEGGSVVLTGQHFPEDKTKSTVKFNGLVAEITDAKTTTLTVTVPEGASSGKITVTIKDKTLTTATEFKVNPNAPVISGINPEKGEENTEVTITGNHFVAGTKVYFGNTEASTVTIVSKTSLKARVPATAATGKVKVLASGLEAISAVDFWIKPVITGFLPEKEEEGKEITINGANFSLTASENIISFGTVAATEITPVSVTQLKVKVPAGAANDKIHVSVKAQEAVSTGSFILLPNLTSYTPDHGEYGSLVTLTGKNFATDAEVYFNNVKITNFEAGRSATTIQFKVPANVTAGKIAINQGGVQKEYTRTYTITNTWVVRKENGGLTDIGGAISFVYDNKIWCGFDRGYSIPVPDSYFRIFDPASNTWTQGPLIPSSQQVAYPVTFTLNGKIFIGTGADINSNYSKKWYQFNPANGSFTYYPNMDLPVETYGGFAFTHNNKAYVGLGRANQRIHEMNGSNSDVTTWSWTSGPDITNSCLYYSSCFVIGNDVYYGAGYNSCGTGVSAQYFKYSLTTKTWNPIADLPVAVQVTNGFSRNGKGYIVTATGKMFEYNPAVGTWKSMASINDVVPYLAIVNDRIYAWSPQGMVAEYIPSY